ncbi:RNA polymerase sigma factor [Rossellomorea sp. YZS02]|uniref:RNA polymerase sigma factor n=1 Tax=Rossellomorea sp. YZS02 TaxID=3097358 RepID=UPI002A0CEC96|nr:RNA polymerase sigma factor [Rossellomorea sp. YZS02]MDX8343106.1 RNA polymerase sigma factor [Rossellomorea sp. YZS02]
MSNNRIVAEWFTLYSDSIYTFLVYRMSSMDVEDLVQEVFIRALNSYESFEGKANPKTWLYSIARNLAVDEQRKRRKQKLSSNPLSPQILEAASLETPESQLFVVEETKELLGHIHKLKPNYRDVLILKGMNEFDVKETAAILGWSENKVRITFHRACKKLQTIMGGYRDEES